MGDHLRKAFEDEQRRVRRLAWILGPAILVGYVSAFYLMENHQPIEGQELYSPTKERYFTTAFGWFGIALGCAVVPLFMAVVAAYRRIAYAARIRWPALILVPVLGLSAAAVVAQVTTRILTRLAKENLSEAARVADIGGWDLTAISGTYAPIGAMVLIFGMFGGLVPKIYKLSKLIAPEDEGGNA